jgi:hypothetical protein
MDAKDGVHISEIGEWNPDEPIPDTGHRIIQHEDGSWHIEDKDGNTVGFGFSTARE